MLKTKWIGIVASATLICSAVLCGCAEKPENKEPEYPYPNYTINEEYIGTARAANDAAYDASKQEMHESPLKDKVIYWLGSSVTYGSASNGQSMADYLAALTGCVSKKDAVSGTTIFDDNKSTATGADSYTRRLVNSKVYDKEEHVDAFICQISTNDARNDRLNKRGEITAANITESGVFDKATTLGGVEFIISYVTETWGCPVYFYSGSYFGDEGLRKGSNPKGSEYGKLVDQVKQIADKYNAIDGYEVGVIDMYNDADFNAKASDNYYSWVMSDAIHPKKAGYLEWWTPYFESYLEYNLILT
ncbi:MAG: SGNH/GDSL hydrolase family protein [Clostridia bacterium]|nr:SGNH/GDSL hydrolase family protein [Clostridia bacterium]